MMASGSILSFATLISLLPQLLQASSFWTVNCDALSVQMSDPIVSPGVASAHVHAIAGGTAFQRTMTGSTAVNAKATTCDKFTDHSNYWCPQLYHMTNGMFELLPFTGVNTYYKNFTCSYNPSGQCSTPRDARAFPDGFRMLAGNTDRRTLDLTDQWQQAILIEGPNGEQYGMPSVLSDRFQADVRFPSCWDGVNLDSPNHQDHVAYPDPSLGGDTEGGMCPKSHPVALISIGSEFGFDLKGVTDPTSLVFSNGDTTGYGFHADFIQGWTNSSALQNSFANCFDNNNCPWRSFDSPTGQDPNPTTRSPEVAPIYEVEIGLNGPISALPGNNPVYSKNAPVASGSSTPKSSSTSKPTASMSASTTGAYSYPYSYSSSSQSQPASSVNAIAISSTTSPRSYLSPLTTSSSTMIRLTTSSSHSTTTTTTQTPSSSVYTPPATTASMQNAIYITVTATTTSVQTTTKTVVQISTSTVWHCH